MDPDRIALDDWHAAADAPDLLDAASAMTEPTPAALAKLRRTASAGVVHAALEIAAARRSAQGRLEDAHTLIADHAGAQQATPAVLAQWKADHIARTMGNARVLDVGCGIGADARWLARRGPVHAIDMSPARCFMATTYAQVEAHNAQITDIAQCDADILHLDPARRDGAGNRRHHPDHWSPTIACIRSIWHGNTASCVMLGPGVDLGAAAIPAHVQVCFCSAGSALLDAAALAGPLASFPAPHTAVQVDSGHLLHGDAADPPPGRPPAVGDVLHVADPAAERAQLLHLLANTHDLWTPAAGLGLLLGNVRADSPWLTGHTIAAVLPPKTKAITQWLGDHDGGVVTVRTRGGAEGDPDRLAHALRGRGTTPWTVWILRMGRRRQALITP